MKQSSLITVLKKHPDAFSPVVPFDHSKESVIAFDFTEGHTTFPSTILNDTREFMALVNEKLMKAGARYGIGGYAENRAVYSMSKVFDAEKEGEEPRRLHLGIDIWGKPYTKVMAPMEGIIHSFAFNNEFGNYGATVILSHILESTRFHTLYGHLSLNSIKNMQEGQRVEETEVFAEFGIPAENGHWPPHLHFQVIADLGEWKGDYPGVCKLSEKERYLDNCPDPDLILQMMRHAT